MKNMKATTVTLARTVDDEPAPLFLLYRTSHMWGGMFECGRTENREELIDADTDANRLRERANAHFALPETIRSERGNHFVIPAFATSSESMSGSGGGCNYSARLVIRLAPTLSTKGKA